MKRHIVLFIIALILLLPVLVNMGLWFYVCADESLVTFEETRDAYLSYFPASFQKPRTLTLLNVLFLGIAGSIFLRLSLWAARALKTICLILTIFCGVLFAWNVFSLM